MDLRADSEEQSFLRKALKRERSLRLAGERAVRIHDELLRGASHELRNPLNSIRLWTQVLRERGSDPAIVARALAGLEHAALLQGHQIDTLLDMSRMALGRLQIDVEPMDLAAMIRGAVESVESMARAQGVAMDLDLGARMGAVSGDPDRLGRVMWHVLVRAVRVTSRAGRVRVSLRRFPEAAVISVSDAGQGGAGVALPTRLAPEDETFAGEAGVGVDAGLVLARRIVELHGGSIEAADTGTGQGVTLSIELPAPAAGLLTAAAAESVSDARPGPRAGAAVSLGGLRVLVVEDEPEALESMRILLQREGAEVAAASSGRQALEAFRRGVFDVLISDIAMPGGDGYHLVRAIRALSPEHGGRVPAVAVTAATRPEDCRLALAAGFQAHLPKPVDAHELLRQVTALSGR